MLSKLALLFPPWALSGRGAHGVMVTALAALSMALVVFSVAHGHAALALVSVAVGVSVVGCWPASVEAAPKEAPRGDHRELIWVGHELRTPLAGVLGAVELLERTELSEEQQELLEMLRTSAEHMLRVVGDLMDLAKLEAGTLQLEERPFLLGAVVEDAVATMGPLAAERGLRLSVSADFAGELEVLGDATRLCQVLVNLLGNALRATRVGCVDVRVLTRPGEGEVQVVIEVEDTGVGICAERLGRIFEPFVQFGGGVGIGLTISRGLAARMGGTVTARSQPGWGSTFTAQVRLPLVGVRPGTADFGGLRVGVCAQDPGRREALRQSLLAQGARVTDSTEVGQLRGSQVDVLVVDVDGEPSSEERERLAAALGLPAVAVVPVVPLGRSDGRGSVHDPCSRRALFASVQRAARGIVRA